MDADYDDAPLLSPSPPEDAPLWRAAHAFSFLLGGTTFIAGTCLLFSTSPLAATLSAALYTLGSLGFLAVDVQEFVTFTVDARLRSNIALSAIGSSLYVAGSVFYFPQLGPGAGGAASGVVLFIAGSAVIAASQAIKVTRLLRADPPPPCVASAVGVEASAGVGASLFLIGSLGVGAGWALALILSLWLIGSIAFTTGGCFLAHRHFVLSLS
jgi:hypothetical protein